MNDSTLELKARCTRCRKVFTLSEAQKKEAREIGVPFSPCCCAVATIESVGRMLKRSKST